jgi:tetratricopeptide (TPR) repeat protein
MEAAAHWPRVRSYLVGALGSWVLFCALATWADLPCWRNTFTIFENAYRNSAHYIACDQLGSLLYARQEFQQSIAVCTRGLEDNAEFASLYNTRGGDYYQLGDLDHALADFNRSIKINPAFAPTYRNRALVYSQLKQFSQARADMEKYLQTGGHAAAAAPDLPAQ